MALALEDYGEETIKKPSQDPHSIHEGRQKGAIRRRLVSLAADGQLSGSPS